TGQSKGRPQSKRTLKNCSAVGDSVLHKPMLETFFAGRQHPITVMIGSNSDEASVMAVFGFYIAGQIQKLRRERRLGL
ncbi:hypothetical protein Q6292_30140, partial [Klebsiella pneumoniae]|nr:hypothetical protein [Klebsiella pneumoniae]